MDVTCSLNAGNAAGIMYPSNGMMIALNFLICMYECANTPLHTVVVSSGDLKYLGSVAKAPFIRLPLYSCGL